MKLCFATTGLLLCLAAGSLHAQQPDRRAVNNGETDFFIEKGRSFSAGTATGAVRKTRPSLAAAATSDVADALQIIRENHVGSGKARGDRAISSAIRSMLRTLDPHSNYYDPAEFAELLGEHQSEYSGTGSTIMNFRRNGSIGTYIVGVADGSPAEKAGIKFGDRVLAVNGTDVAAMNATDVSKLVRGPRGSTVVLHLETAASGEQVNKPVRRDRVTQPTVPAAFLMGNGVGYINMGVGFSYTTVTEFDAAISSLKQKGAASLVLDLRGNRGGILDQAVAVAERLLPAGQTIVSQRGKYPTEDRTWKSSNARPETMPIVLLVDGETASAAEVLAGALQDNDRAIIVGSRTFGKGLVQSVVQLENGAGLTLTAARYYTPSGRSIQREYSDDGLYDYYKNTEQPALTDRSVYATRTLTNRPVYGGNGIEPDISSAPETVPPGHSTPDTAFFFVRDLLEGRLSGLPARDEIRRRIVFREDVITPDIIERFRRLYSQQDEEDGRLAAHLSYLAALGAFGITAAHEVQIRTDAEVETAAKAVHKARELATAAASIRP